MFVAIKNKPVFYFLVVFLIICKLFYWFFVFPNPDEAYYWHWGQFPALSYHDHPGLQANIQGLFYKLFGKSLFVLRLPAFLCSVVCGYIIYLFSKKLAYKNNILFALLFFSSPLFFLFTSFAWNDYILVTNCLIAGYFIIDFLVAIYNNKKGKTQSILLGGLFLGLAMISKYNAVFLIIAVFTCLLFNKKLHVIFKDYRFYLAFLILIIAASPIAIWNLQNQFGSFEFNIQQRTLNPLLKLQFKGNIGGFLIGSLVLVSPFFWWGIIKSWKQNNNTNYSIIYTKFAKHVFLVSSISFLLLALFSNVLYYWNIVAYLFIIPLAINFIIQTKKVLASLIFSCLVIGGAIFHFGIIPFTTIFGGQDQDSTYHYGWNKIKNNIEILQGKEPAVLLTSSYRKASLLAFALDTKNVFSFSQRFDQFDYWTKDYYHPTKNTKAIILTDDRIGLTNDLKDKVDNIKLIDTIKINKFNYFIKEYYLYSGKTK